MTKLQLARIKLLKARDKAVAKIDADFYKKLDKAGKK
jgi:hypothetical protein